LATESLKQLGIAKNAFVGSALRHMSGRAFI